MHTRRRIRPLTIEQLADRVRREFAALPGLHLTGVQARRVWGLDDSSCDDVFRRLVEARFLDVTPGGYYVRADLARSDPAVPRARARKAD